MHVVVASVSSANSPGGVCRHAANIVRGIVASPSIKKVTMLTGVWQANYFRSAFHLADPKLEVKEVSIPNSSLSRNLWYLFGLPAAARACAADLVHLAYPMPVLRRKFNGPIILSLHDMYAHQVPENFRGRAWLNRAALRIALANTDVTACVSEETRAALHHFFPNHHRDRTVVIPNSIYLPRNSRSNVLPKALSGVPLLLCVAQHRANKNLPFLLNAFRLACDRGLLPPNAKLVILGREGPETARLHRIVSQQKIAENIVFLSGISDELLSTLYLRSELVIAPSLLEGFGLPVGEALDSGARVVCSDIPAFRAIGAGRCVFFDPLNAPEESLLRAIAQAREMPRVTGAASVSHSPEQEGRLCIALYDMLLERQKSSQPIRPSRTLHHPVSERNLP